MHIPKKYRIKVDKKADSNYLKWLNIGYKDGLRFFWEEADYDELAAIVRTRNIPCGWDIFRAEIINHFVGEASFDFQAYAAGFVSACTAIYQKL